MLGFLRGAWNYRHFILSSIRSEFQARFARSRLGGFWMIIHPLVQVLIFSFILSGLMTVRMPGISNRYAYVIYLMAGTLVWSLFFDIIQRSLTIFIDNANLLKKMVFPRICLPMIVTGSAITANIMLLVAVTVVFALLGHFPGPSLLFLPVLIILTIGLATGLGLMLGILNVFMRDIGQVVPILLQVGYWFTPIVYLPEIIPIKYRAWLVFNPLYALVSGYHDILVFGKAPAWPTLLPVTVLSILLLFISLYLFRRANVEMVDVL
ncbi:MAG: ABC transporter permease [Geobacter sp.]|nr:ABC transporter permease [Geobacter sp.]